MNESNQWELMKGINMTIQTILVSSFVILFGLLIGRFLTIAIHQKIHKEDILYFCNMDRNNGSIRYLVIEFLNTAAYIWILKCHGFNIHSMIECFITSILIMIGIIDEKIKEISIGCNYMLGVLGLIELVIDSRQWYNKLLGMISVSGLLMIIYLCTKGKGIGGGDIKFMAVCGFLLGFPKIVLAFMLGCVLALVIHIVRMVVSKAGRVFALGPYLCIGIWSVMLYADEICRLLVL